MNLVFPVSASRSVQSDDFLLLLLVDHSDFGEGVIVVDFEVDCASGRTSSLACTGVVVIIIFQLSLDFFLDTNVAGSLRLTFC
jgi:hypothetical protein